MKLFFCFSVLIVSLVGIAVANHLLTEFEAWKDPRCSYSGQVFTYCSSACPAICGQPKNDTCYRRGCTPGCSCREGYILDLQVRKCIQLAECLNRPRNVIPAVESDSSRVSGGSCSFTTNKAISKLVQVHSECSQLSNTNNQLQRVRLTLCACASISLEAQRLATNGQSSYYDEAFQVYKTCKVVGGCTMSATTLVNRIATQLYDIIDSNIIQTGSVRLKTAQSRTPTRETIQNCTTVEQCSDEINGMIIANIGDNITYNDDIAIQTVVIRIKVSSNGECIIEIEIEVSIENSINPPEMPPLLGLGLKFTTIPEAVN